MGIKQTLLHVGVGLLMVDSIIELSFISSMVAWLHRRAGGEFEVSNGATSFDLHGKPLHLLVDQGHTSNGAAGTAFVLVGLGGILVLFMRSGRRQSSNSKTTLVFYHTWLVMTLLSMALTLSALIYTFVVTNDHRGQLIDVAVASQLNNRPYPNYVAYPLDRWTPENWFNAVLTLSLDDDSDRNAIKLRLAIMRGWRWNLVPMFILGVAVCVLAFYDAISRRKATKQGRHLSQEPKRLGSDI